MITVHNATNGILFINQRYTLAPFADVTISDDEYPDLQGILQAFLSLGVIEMTVDSKFKFSFRNFTPDVIVDRFSDISALSMLIGRTFEKHLYYDRDLKAIINKS